MAKNEKEIRIKLHSELYEVDASLFSEEDSDTEDFSVPEDSPSPIICDVNSFARYVDDGERISVSYTESEATGMEGSITELSFLKNEPTIVTMTRNGIVSTTLVFEEGKRYHCIYKTPYMPFEVCVRTVKVDNAILGVGRLLIDYIIEIRGAKAERTKLELQLFV